MLSCSWDSSEILVFAPVKRRCHGTTVRRKSVCGLRLERQESLSLARIVVAFVSCNALCVTRVGRLLSAGGPCCCAHLASSFTKGSSDVTVRFHSAVKYATRPHFYDLMGTELWNTGSYGLFGNFLARNALLYRHSCKYSACVMYAPRCHGLRAFATNCYV